jgi:hypothetical protein
MSELAALQNSTPGLHTLKLYELLIRSQATELFVKMAERLRTQHVARVSSTFHGGGVGEI